LVFDSEADARSERGVHQRTQLFSRLCRVRTAGRPQARVTDGADSFVIENGWIVAQTVHYTVQPKF
jgi:hypothetical protein